MEWIAIAAALLTGFGTTTLAFFTWRLAGTTKADVEAQWRPMLVPRFHQSAAMPGMRLHGWLGWAEVLDDNEVFLFSFQNIGKGPALKVRGSVAKPPLSATFVPCGALASPVFAVDDRTAFRFPNVAIADNRVRVRVYYADLAGHPQRTDAVYKRVPDGNPEWVVESVEPVSLS
jgi:hypothetical protein